MNTTICICANTQGTSMDGWPAGIDVNCPVCGPKGPRAVLHPVRSSQDKIRDLEKRVEELELIASYARDVVDFWPTMTMRTIRVMIPKMDNLKEALEMYRK